MAGDGPPSVPVYDLISPCYYQLSLAGRVRNVVQTLTCRDEIIVVTKAIIIVKAYWSRSRIVQIFIFIFILYPSSMIIYGAV